MDNKIDLSQYSNCPLSSAKTWNAVVFVYTGPYESIVPLGCKVNFRNLNVNSLQEMLLQSDIWNDMQDARERTSVDYEKRASCSIPDSCMPSAEKIQEWALKSLEADPTSGIGSLHEWLFLLSTEYVRSSDRPLVYLRTLA
jgi:hypothetical protein